MSMIRWDPYGEMLTLREAMNRIFGETPSETGAGMRIPTDVVETENDIILKAALPGVDPEDVDISITGNTISIRAECCKAAEEERGQRYLLRERQHGRFARELMVPMDIQPDKAQATFESGILVLTIPKAEAIKPRRIQVKPGS